MSPDLDPMEFARIAEALRTAPTPARTAEQIVSYVRDQLSADYAGITMIRDGKLQTVAATEPLVAQIDAVQHELDEGPCRDSSWMGETLVVSDVATDDRWPRWGAKVTALGIASVLAAELTGGQRRRLGSINVFWTQRRMLVADDIAFVNIFARHAAVALADSLDKAGLNIALDSRKRIGQAQGILMERYNLDETRAFEVLRRYSQNHNIKLRCVAEELVADRKLPTAQRVSQGQAGTDEPS